MKRELKNIKQANKATQLIFKFSLSFYINILKTEPDIESTRPLGHGSIND